MKIIIVLVIMYGRGEASIAEQLGCDVDEAKEIKNSVYDAFPRIKSFERESSAMVKTKGYVTTLWGRKRRLPNYNLPTYSFYYLDSNNNIIPNKEVPQDIQQKYIDKLVKAYWKTKAKIIEDAKKEEQILIVDNSGKIADAGRQIINSRVQGSAADMSKLALIKIHNDEELNKRGVKTIIPVHDEILIETPLRYAKFVKKQFSHDMETAAADTGKLTIPVCCDVVSTNEWYGEELDLDAILDGLPEV